MKHMITKLMAVGLLAGGGGAYQRCHGQEESARITTLDARTSVIQQETVAQTQVNLGHPELGEINVVQKQTPPPSLIFQTNQLISYTSNAFLRPDDEQGSLLWNGRIAASWVPYSTRSFTPSISVEENAFRFDRFSTLDFDTQTAGAAVKFDLTRDDSWSTTTSVSLTRLFTDRFDAKEFYKYMLVTESVTYIRQLGQSPIYSGTTLGGSLRLGNPSTYDRFAIFLNLAAIYSPTETVQFAAFVRPEVHLFTNHDSSIDHHGDGENVFEDEEDDEGFEMQKHPTDFNLSAGLSVTWTPVKYVSLGANFLWTGNWSTYEPHDYQVVAPSVSLSAAISF